MVNKKDCSYVLEAVIELFMMIKLITKMRQQKKAQCSEPKTTARLQGDNTDQVVSPWQRAEVNN